MKYSVRTSLHGVPGPRSIHHCKDDALVEIDNALGEYVQEATGPSPDGRWWRYRCKSDPSFSAVIQEVHE